MQVLVGIDADKDAATLMFGNGTLDAGRFAIASKRLADRAKVIAERLAADRFRSPPKPLPRSDIGESWPSWTLAQKRAVLRVTVDIAVEPMGRRTPNQEMSEGLTIEWIAKQEARRD